MDRSSLEPRRSIWPGFSYKVAIFGALEAWIGAWNWQKRLPHQCNGPMYEKGFDALGASFKHKRDHSSRKCDRKGQEMRKNSHIMAIF